MENQISVENVITIGPFIIYSFFHGHSVPEGESQDCIFDPNKSERCNSIYSKWALDVPIIAGISHGLNNLHRPYSS